MGGVGEGLDEGREREGSVGGGKSREAEGRMWREGNGREGEGKGEGGR